MKNLVLNNLTVKQVKVVNLVTLVKEKTDIYNIKVM